MAFDSAKPNTSQTIGDVIVSTRSNLNDLLALLEAHEDGVDVHGLVAINASIADYVAHKTASTAHGLDVTTATLSAVQSEVQVARGSQASLTARLDAAMMPSGAFKIANLASKWIDNGDLPTYSTNRIFTVPGDRTGVYFAGINIRATVSGSYVYGTILSSSYAGGITTVTLDTIYTVLAVGLTKVEISILAFDNSIADSITSLQSTQTAMQGQITSITNLNSKAGLPTTSDVTAGRVAVWKNTTDSTVRLYVNDGGTLMSVQLT